MTTSLNTTDYAAMDQRYRAAFFNSLGGFKSLTLVGTVNGEGQTNLSVVSSVFHIGANPPLIGMIFRPESAERHTLDNILETGFYTFNHVKKEFYQKAHQTSARYNRAISEFEACGLAPWYSENIKAPYVLESNIRLGIKLVQRMDLTINGTVMVLGEIMETFFPSDCLEMDGFLNLEKAGSITVSGLDSYHTTQSLGRLPYAKP